MASRTVLDEFLEQAVPLHTEEVGPGETAVASDYHEVGDAQLHQVLRRLETPPAFPEILAPCAPDHRPAL